MIRLVKAEVFKLLKNKTFRVLCIISLILSAIMIIMTTPVMTKLIDESMKQIENTEDMEMFIKNSDEPVNMMNVGISFMPEDPTNPTVLEVFHSSFGTGLTEILIGILIAAMLAKEYSEGTIKNTLAYGGKRSKFYLAKFIAMIVGIIAILASLTILSSIGSFIINGWGQEFEVSQLINILKTFGVAIISNASVAAIIMLIAILLKSNGGTIGTVIGIFFLFPTFISFIYGKYEMFDKIFKVLPFYNNRLSTAILATNGDMIKCVSVSLITIICSLIVGIEIFKKQDIK